MVALAGNQPANRENKLLPKFSSSVSTLPKSVVSKPNIIMKIAFIVGEFPVLSQTFVLYQITGLIDRGHEVDIFAGKPGNDTIVHEEVKKYNLLERTYYCFASDGNGISLIEISYT